MSRNPFGWSLPPGVTQKMIDDQVNNDEPDEGDNGEPREMRGEAYIYKTNNEIEHLTFDARVPLQVIKDAVGGYIESVPYWTKHRGMKCVAFCNEEGKLNNLPYNVRANNAWMQERTHDVDDVLVGDIIVIMGNDAFMEEL